MHKNFGGPMHPYCCHSLISSKYCDVLTTWSLKKITGAAKTKFVPQTWDVFIKMLSPFSVQCGKPYSHKFLSPPCSILVNSHHHNSTCYMSAWKFGSCSWEIVHDASILGVIFLQWWFQCGQPRNFCLSYMSFNSFLKTHGRYNLTTF